MKFKKLNSDKEININISKYLIDWKRKVSGPQKLVKDCLYPYWKTHVVLEEFVIPGSLHRLDLFNITNHIIVEVSPSETHTKFNKFFHGSRAGFINVMRRDENKRKWAEDNHFALVEVYSDDLKEFEKGRVKEWFLDKYQIYL